MNLGNFASAFVRRALGLDDLFEKISSLQRTNEEIVSRIDSIEKRMVESTRAVATLALVQANLIKEIGDIAERYSEKESHPQKSHVRKSGTDFTN